MRTRIILISTLLVAFAGAVALAATSEDASGGGDPRRVAASFYPLAFAAERIAGSEVEVENMTPPGAEPHDIELNAGAVEDLRTAGTVLLMGRDFQPQLEQAAELASGEVVEVLEAPGVRLRSDDDPHLWLDPALYARVARRIDEALGEPGGLAPFTARLHGLDRHYSVGLEDCARREIVTSHDAFGYLADRYGLRQIPITGISPEAEPSPGEISDAIDRLRQAGATVVFTESLLSPRLAETVARETGAETETLSTLETLTEEERTEGEDYFSLMRENLSKLREALGCH